MKMRPVWAEINLKAIEKNIETLKGLLKPHTLFMAVVKANGYGHGAVEVARTAIKAGADRLGVALAEEALELRRAGVAAPIHILSEIPADAAQDVVEHDFIATVSSERAAEVLAREASRYKKTVRVHLKVDTGMSRLGISPDGVPAFLFLLAAKPELQLEGIFTHFATADQPANPFWQKQLQEFQGVMKNVENWGTSKVLRHAANSAATILLPQTHLDMVRIGIALYGLHPSAETKKRVELQPVLSLKAKISYLRELRPDQGVSYGLTYRSPKETVVAVLPLGYADGYSRLLSNKSEVLVAGKRTPVVGTICMDQMMVDVGAIPGVSVGDEAVLIGQQGRQEISADELASILGTINYEITCMISSRVPRMYT